MLQIFSAGFSILHIFLISYSRSGTESTLPPWSPSSSCQRWSTALIYSGCHDDYDDDEDNCDGYRNINDNFLVSYQLREQCIKNDSCCNNHEEHTFNVDKYALLRSDKSRFVQQDKIIGGNGCKYYLSVSILYLASARITSLLRKLNYDSPPIANKFSFIILQNKHTAWIFLS